MDYKELAIYAVIAVVIVMAVVFLLSNSLLKSSYNLQVTISQLGATATYPYQTSVFLINVTNKGNQPIDGMPVGFYINGVQQTINNTSIPPGQTVTLVRNFTYTDIGAFYFQAIADPGQTFNIENRQLTKSSLNINITRASSPNIYTSIPQNNITATQTFTMGSAGAIGSAAIDQQYNISIVDELFGPEGNITNKIFEDGYSGIAVVNGGYAKYANGSTAYTVWFQGTVTPAFINYVLSSFGLTAARYQSNGNQVYQTLINKSTSICDLYSGGWTKLITYYNNSLPGTCLNLGPANYSVNESKKLQQIIGLNKNLTQLEAYFYYTNSTNLGSIIGYSQNNLTLSQLFQNNASGLFISSIKRLNSSINITDRNATCNGIVHINGSLNLCSYVIPVRSGFYQLPFQLMNSSYITSNYIMNLYSLVNNTLLFAAEYNAGKLIGAVAAKANIINTSSIQWKSPFKNSCAFFNKSNQSIGCTIKNFTTENYTAYLGLTNNFKSPVRVNSLLCEIAPGFSPVAINQTMMPNSTISVALQCNIIPSPQVAAQTSYILTMNYTYLNTTQVVNGTMFINNQLAG